MGQGSLIIGLKIIMYKFSKDKQRFWQLFSNYIEINLFYVFIL
jgi:hypothetical protein